MRGDTILGDVGYGQVSSILFAEVGQGRNVAPVRRGVEGQDRGVHRVAQEEVEWQEHYSQKDLEPAPAANVGEDVIKFFHLDALLLLNANLLHILLCLRLGSCDTKFLKF